MLCLAQHKNSRFCGFSAASKEDLWDAHIVWHLTIFLNASSTLSPYNESQFTPSEMQNKNVQINYLISSHFLPPLHLTETWKAQHHKSPLFLLQCNILWCRHVCFSYCKTLSHCLCHSENSRVANISCTLIPRKLLLGHCSFSESGTKLMSVNTQRYKIEIADNVTAPDPKHYNKLFILLLWWASLSAALSTIWLQCRNRER